MRYLFFIADVITILLAMFVASYILDFMCITVSPVLASVSVAIVIIYGVIKTIYFMECNRDVSE